MTDRPTCLARIPKEGEWFKFKDTEGHEVRKRCFKEFRCEYFATRDGLCERHWQKELEFKKCGGGVGKYDARHPMKNWVGRIRESWPEQHAPFWDSPEYHVCVKNGLRLDREEIDICRKVRDLAEGVDDSAAESAAEGTKKSLKTADVVKQDMAKPRPKRATTVAAAAAVATSDSLKAVPNVLYTEEPILFRDNKTPFKVSVIQKITREQLREHILEFLDTHPEMKSLFS